MNSPRINKELLFYLYEDTIVISLQRFLSNYKSDPALEEVSAKCWRLLILQTGNNYQGQ
jgi:hypothetical protein